MRDVERDIVRSYTLGEGHSVFREHVVVGSDPSCDVIIDHPDVPARAAEFYPGGHHFYHRVLPDGEATRAPHAVRMGPFEVFVGWGYQIDLLAGDEPALPIRFGARGLGGAYLAGAQDPRVVEVRRLAAALSVSHAIDEAWCEERVRIFSAAITWATTPRRSLEACRILYATPEAASTRYARAWSIVDSAPFDRDAFAYAHRLDLWVNELLKARGDEYAMAAVLVGAIDVRAWPEPLRRVVHEIAALHVMTLADDVSPARPLAVLLERGVVPIVLPDGVMMLCTPAAPDDDREGELASAFSDPAVFADFLEQRGETRQAQRVHGGAVPNADLEAQRNVERFDRVPLVIGKRNERATWLAPAGLASEPPTATLELAGTIHALGVANAFTVDGTTLRVGPAASPDEAMIERRADGSLWLRGTGQVLDVSLNGRRVYRDVAMPLFDGDVLAIEANFYQHGRHHQVDATAILHDP